MDHLDQAALRKDIEARVSDLDAAKTKEVQSLAEELARDWAREADGDSDAADINKVQRQDLEKALAGTDAVGRLVALRVHTVERLVRHVAGQAYKLGCALIDGKVAREAGREQGKQLLGELEKLSERAKNLGDTDAEARIRRDLGDAMMDSLYAVEGKAMSLRLGRYQHSP